MPSGIDRDQRAADVHAGAVGHQPGQRAHPEPVARGAVRARVGEEPAGHPERQADQQRAGRRGGAGQRAPGARAGAGGAGRAGAPPPTGGCGRASARSLSHHLRGRGTPYVAATPTPANRAHEWAPSGRGRYRGRPCPPHDVLRLPRCAPPPNNAAGTPEKLMPRTLPRSNPRSPEGFEAFYKDVRGRLLLQSYALTGDLLAAQRAVRDAMVVAWHHWRKVSRLEEPEDYVRPLAWTRAQRRSTRPLVGPAEGHRRRDPGHARRAREAVHHPAQGAPADPPDRAPDRPHGARGRHHPRQLPSGSCRRRARTSPCTARSRPPRSEACSRRSRRHWSRSAGRGPRS